MSAPSFRAAPRLALWSLLLIPAWLAVWSAYAIWLTYSPIPFNDQWVNVQAMKDAPHVGWIRYLFSQHNEHRILVPRLVFLADWTWFQGRNGLNLVAIGLFQLLGGACFVHAALSQRPKALGVFGLTAAVAMIASLMQWENLFWGFQVSFVAVYAAGVWAIYLFCRAAFDETRTRFGLLAAAMAFFVVATFSMANGVFAGAAMVLVGLLARRRGFVITAGLVTAVLLAVYLQGYHRPEAHSPPGLALQHPGRFVFYVSVFLGNLWAPGRPDAAALIGLVGMAATFAMFVLLLRKDGRDPVRAALFGVVLFVGMSAAVTSLGRLNFGVVQALSSRYITPTAYFWASHALFWALTLERGSGGWISLSRTPEAWVLTLQRGLIAWARLGLAVVFGLLLWRLIHLQPLAAEQALINTRERMLSASSALLGGIDDPQAFLGVYPDAHIVESLAPFLRETHTSVFADPPGATVGAAFRRPLAPATSCRGFFDFLIPSPDGIWRAKGWGWDVKARRTFSRVVLVDGSGQVLGIGLSGMPRPDVSKAVSEVRDGRAGWIALIRQGAGPEVTAYGLTEAGAACELGRKRWPS